MHEQVMATWLYKNCFLRNISSKNGLRWDLDIENDDKMNNNLGFVHKWRQAILDINLDYINFRKCHGNMKRRKLS